MSYARLKRAIDFGAASFGLVLLSPLLVLAAAAIWIEDRHSPFFLGTRVGRSGRRFRMLKFRTMIPDAWRSGVSSTPAGDLRITRTGAWLRRVKLDEFPQLWNVLRGEMSLVGPRPQVEPDASMYTAEEQRLFSVRPGITDLASIVFADEADILAGAAHPDLRYNQIIRPWKSRLALAAIDHVSLASDLAAVGLTLLSALSRKWALDGVARLLHGWNLDPMVLRMASRRDALEPWPPPGATEIVDCYPGAERSLLPGMRAAGAAGVPAESLEPASKQRAVPA